MHVPQFTKAIIHRLSAGYFAVFITLGVSRSFLGPSLLEFSRNTSAQLKGISFLFVLLALGNVTGNWVGGRLYDRLPGNRVLIVVAICISVLLAFVPLVADITLLAVLILMVGIGYGTLEAGGNTLMMWLHGRLAGPYLSGLYVFTGLGSLATPALIGLSIDLAHTIRFAFWIFGLFALPAIILLMPMPNPRQAAATTNEVNKRIDYTLAGFIFLLFVLCVGAQASFSGWLYTYAVTLELTSELNAAFLTSLYWMAQTTGLVLSIPLLARLRPQYLLVYSLSGGLLSLILFLTWKNPAALWVGAVGLGLSMSSLFPASFAFVGQRMSITGKLNGWFLSGASTGAMVVPWIVGQVFVGLGPQHAMRSVTAILGLGYLLLLGYLGLRRRS